MHYFLLAVSLSALSCNNNGVDSLPKRVATAPSALKIFPRQVIDTTSWEYFLQHLPEAISPVVDYKGREVDDQSKKYSVIIYDVGNRDLQQCADALIRLRAEYLFSRKRFSEIAFHFTNGDLYTYNDYCNGKKPVPKGTSVSFINGGSQPQTHRSLRNYLDIVYTYAGTISVARELKTATEFAIGTVVISPGSPGHCFIITDEATAGSGEKLYKLVEGYTPAQSIYVLNNTEDASLGYWHRLSKGAISTASYHFGSYLLKTFE